MDMLRHQLEIYFMENPMDADKIAGQVLINKRSREDAENQAQPEKEADQQYGHHQPGGKVCGLPQQGREPAGDLHRGRDSALGACKQAETRIFQAIIPIRGKILNCLKADYDKIFKNDIITDLIKVLGCGV